VAQRPNTPTWIRELRSLIKREHGLGWSLSEQSDAVKLTRRFADGARSSVQLDLPWNSSSATAVLTQLQAIRSRMEEAGLGLAEAAASLGAETTTTGAGPALDWDQLVRAFKKHKTVDTGDVKTSTWKEMYAPVMVQVIAAAAARPAPRSGQALLTALRDTHGGEPGSQGRRQRILYAAQLLRFAVERLGVAPSWAPPSDLSPLVGKKREPKRNSTPITDDQIKVLLEGIPDPRWCLLVQLLVCFGLRPVEARYCRPSKDRTQLEVAYCKRTSRGSTKPRAVFGMDPVGLEGLSDQVLAYLAAGRPLLPPLGSSDGVTANALTIYLNRRPAWQQLKADAATTGERLTAYSLRHGYALRAHEVYRLSPRVTAALMGHSLLTHTACYGQWTDQRTIEQAIAQSRQQRERHPARLAGENAVHP
jgi:integrase